MMQKYSDTRTEKENIENKVLAYCRHEKLFDAPHGRQLRVAAAVSGGADSMALLHLLIELRGVCGFELCACHVNHGLRGATADRDEAFVKAECHRLGVEVRTFHASDFAGMLGEPPQHAGEDWARRLRYACFEQLRSEGVDCIATAHTATDQAETLLFRLARGAGIHGAAGIRPKREGYIRPLLCISRADTEKYCKAYCQSWVHDETNDSDDYARNRLRHSALPALRTVNTAAEQNLARFCEKASRADAYFEHEAQKLMLKAGNTVQAKQMPAAAKYAAAAGLPVWHLEPMQQADLLILETAMHGLVSPVRDAEEKYVRLMVSLVQRGKGAVQLTDDVRFAADNGFLWQENPDEKAKKTEFIGAQPQAFEPDKKHEYVLSGGYMLKARLTEPTFREKTQDVHKKDLKNQADYARIITSYSAPVLRTRQPGDRYKPAGRGVSKELRKWMNEVGIPPEQRNTLPLLADGSEVLWVCGAGFADGLAPGKDCRQVLQFELHKTEEED